MYKSKSFSVVIPCHNEAPRISNVLRVVFSSKYVDEIIVVDDASTDNSVERVLDFKEKIKLIRHNTNQGKAKAVFDGIKEASSNAVFLMDADLVNLEVKHIDDSIQQFCDKELDMLLIPLNCFSISTFLQLFTEVKGDAVLTGQRIIERSKILPHIGREELGYGLELHINKVAKQENWDVDVILWGDSIKDYPKTPWKFQKYGILNGLRKELEMRLDILKESNVSHLLRDFTEVAKKKRSKRT